MTWGRIRKGGWSQSPESEPVSRFTQVIRTVISVMPGGVIRYAKTGPDDDAHTGFWLGVTPEGVARFSVGGPSFWLKWTGTALLVRGRFSTLGGDGVDERLRWVGADGHEIASVAATDAWGHQLLVRADLPDVPDEPAMIALQADGDLDLGRVRLVLWTTVADPGGAYAAVEMGRGVTVWKVSGIAGDVWCKGTLNCADPTEDSHAMTRRAGDARYVSRVAGASGTFMVAPGKTLTFVDGQLTAAGGW